MNKTKRPTYRTNGSSPPLVLGTAGLGGAWGKVDLEESVETILHALEQGIRRLDTAPAYNRAEKVVGRALQQWEGRRPFVSTKVGKLFSTAADIDHNNYDRPVMTDSLEESLEHLQTASVDLLFLHEPERVPSDQIPTVVNFLQSAKQEGKVQQIGLGGVVTASYHPYIRQGIFDVVMGFNNLDACTLSGLEKDIPFFKEQGLTVYQASALHMGLLGNRYERYRQTPPDWISPGALRNAERAKQIADRYDMKLPDLAHRFLLSIQEVDFLVLGARKMSQLKNTFAAIERGGLEETIFNQLIHQIQVS